MRGPRLCCEPCINAESLSPSSHSRCARDIDNDDYTAIMPGTAQTRRYATRSSQHGYRTPASSTTPDTKEHVFSRTALRIKCYNTNHADTNHPVVLIKGQRDGMVGAELDKRVYCPDGAVAAECVAALGVRHCPEGLIAGTPVGTAAFVEQSALARAIYVCSLIDGLMALPLPQQLQFVLLRMSVEARTAHFLRTLQCAMWRLCCSAQSLACCDPPLAIWQPASQRRRRLRSFCGMPAWA
jgi:hypothetical protein